jgi:hypothetical protein
MATMTVARCPKCKVEVGSTWRWCLACGYDPDGSKQRVRQAAIEARRREGGWLPVIIVLVGLVIGGIILWRTTPDESSLPTVSRSTAAEVTEWLPFTPPSGGIEVDLPGTPAPSPPGGAGTAGQPIERFAIGAGDHFFDVAVIETGRPGLAQDPAAVQVLLRQHIDELAAGVAGTVMAAAPPGDTTSQMDFAIEGPAVGQVRGRGVAVGTRLAVVSVSSRQLSPELADHVLQSVEVRPVGPSPAGG